METKAKAIKNVPEDGDDAEKQLQQPPRKVARKIKGGQMREYIFLDSVNSMEELDKLRFKHSCLLLVRKALPTFKSHHIMICTRKISRYEPGVRCDFELMALRQANGTIDVYAHGEHNHLIEPEEKRGIYWRTKELMPAENPPQFFWTPDNTEWTFLHTFADYAQMQQFRHISKCKRTGKENHRRFRFPCKPRKWHNCEFKLLALKTTSQGYHVYTFGEHNHSAIKPNKKQQPAAACVHQQQKQPAEMEVNEDDEEEDDDDDGQNENEAGEDGEEDEAEEDENEEDDDIIVIEDEDNIIKIEVEQQQQKVKREGSEKITETLLENEAIPREEAPREETPRENTPREEAPREAIPRENTPREEAPREATTIEETPRMETLELLEGRLQTAIAKVYAWMAGIEPDQIGPTLEAWDNSYLLKMVEIGDQEIREHPEKLDLWRPFLKCAIKKCMSQTEDFGTKYKDLIILMVEHD